MDDRRPDSTLVGIHYTEASNTFRHYAAAMLRVRAIIVAQGIAIFAAAAYLFYSNRFVGCAVACGFGGSLTLALSAMQWHYRCMCSSILDYLTTLESRGDFRSTEVPGFWSAFAAARNTPSPSTELLEWAAEWVPFIVFTLAFGGLFAASVRLAPQQAYGSRPLFF